VEQMGVNLIAGAVRQKGGASSQESSSGGEKLVASQGGYFARQLTRFDTGLSKLYQTNVIGLL
jgi:hypothetical protein